MLSLNQVRRVCYGDTSKPSSLCRYLEIDDFDASKSYCLKLIQSKKNAIDNDVADFIMKSKGRNINPNSENVPLGDNCQGYIKLKSISQGYDCVSV